MKLTKNIKLNPTYEQRTYIKNTTRLYIDTVNNILASFNNGCTTKITSKDVEVELPSCIKNNCINDARSIFSKYRKDRKKDKDKKLPLLKKEVSIWNNQNYKIDFNDSFISFPIFINNKSTIIKVEASLVDVDNLKTNKLGTLRIVLKNGKLYAQISYEEVELVNNDVINIMGVDLGLKVPAVCVTGCDTTLFVGNGRKNKYIRRMVNIRKKQLGKAKKLEAIRKEKDKEARIMKDIDHKISRSIVNVAVSEKVEIIRLERLSNIRESTRTSRKNKRNIHTWSFYRLAGFIEYKANLLGIKIEYVDPRNTSKRCPRCGNLNTSKDREYRCTCGYHGHRDRVGAINILNTYDVPMLYGNSITA
jgi:putative transposase